MTKKEKIYNLSISKIVLVYKLYDDLYRKLKRMKQNAILELDKIIV